MRFSTEHSLVPASVFEEAEDVLRPYIRELGAQVRERDYDFPECSLLLPSDRRILRDLEMIKSRLDISSLRYIFLIGVGGSSLGARAIYDMRFGFFDILERERNPKIIFLETFHGVEIKKLQRLFEITNLGAHEIAIILVSKSGTTLESLANAEVLINLLNEFRVTYAGRLIIITDEGSPLWRFAVDRELMRLSIPAFVGGRYSVLSSAALLPLSLIGLDINALILGALHERSHGLVKNIQKNGPAQSAAILSYYLRSGRNIHDTFLFAPELESLGKWYRQLLAESIGKSQGGGGGVGLTPTVSVGTSDLHSVAQLTFAGPRDKVTTFVSVENVEADYALSRERIFLPRLEVGDATLHDMMESVYKAVLTTYIKEGLPFMELRFERLSPRSLGSFMQFKMLEVMFLGRLLGVNAFDQPAVELYKNEVRRILNP